MYIVSEEPEEPNEPEEQKPGEDDPGAGEEENPVDKSDPVITIFGIWRWVTGIWDC